MTRLQFHQFTCRQDNFCVLVHDTQSGQCASIDAPDEAAVTSALKETGWQLSHILVTHWHFDHVEGLAALKSKSGCHVIAPALEADKINGIDQQVNDGDEFDFGDEKVKTISTPGHTLGMVNFHFPKAKVVFTGDTLFALGCGRIFEGDGPMMWNSLKKLSLLPKDTKVYCGHEYTLANGKFALGIDPENQMLKSRMEQVIALRNSGKATLPTTIGEELDTNPFMRAANPAIRKHLGMENASDEEVFTQIRTRKDNF